jgi:hypothetical protein
MARRRRGVHLLLLIDGGPIVLWLERKVLDVADDVPHHARELAGDGHHPAELVLDPGSQGGRDPRVLDGRGDRRGGVVDVEAPPAELLAVEAEELVGALEGALRDGRVVPGAERASCSAGRRDTP